MIEAAGLNDPEKLKAIIGKTAKLTFQMVDDAVPPADAAAGHVPPEDMVAPGDDHRLEISGIRSPATPRRGDGRDA